MSESLLDARAHAPQTPAASTSRRDFLCLGALAGAALLLPAIPSLATSLGYGDTKSLRFLEEVAVFQANFFTKAALSATADGLSEREMNLINLCAKQDEQQAQWFKTARQRYNIPAFGSPHSSNFSVPRSLPDFKFGQDVFSTRAKLLNAATEIKDFAVGAFHGQVEQADSPEFIGAFAALAGVQNRHLAFLREVLDQDPFVPYVPALSRREATRGLAKYGFKTEANS